MGKSRKSGLESNPKRDATSTLSSSNHNIWVYLVLVKIRIPDCIVGFEVNIAITMHECANKGVSCNLWIDDSKKLSETSFYMY